MKKVISLILVLAMTAALFCTPAFAATYGSKSRVEDVDADDGLIFWDNVGIYDKYEDLENRKIIAYTAEDLANAVSAAMADINAKKEAGTANKADEALAALLADVDAASLKPLFVKHFKWANEARESDPISFELTFEGTEDAKVLMLYRDARVQSQANSWKLVDADTDTTVNVNGVNRGTVAVLIVSK